MVCDRQRATAWILIVACAAMVLAMAGCRAKKPKPHVAIIWKRPDGQTQAHLILSRTKADIEAELLQAMGQVLPVTYQIVGKRVGYDHDADRLSPDALRSASDSRSAKHVVRKEQGRLVLLRVEPEGDELVVLLGPVRKESTFRALLIAKIATLAEDIQFFTNCPREP